MDSVNELYNIINNKNIDQNNTIYDELKKKEDKYYDTINRVIDVKNKEVKMNTYFEYTTIKDVTINLFLALNAILKEVVNYDYSSFDADNYLLIFTSKHRIIYIGIFLIMLSIFMLLVEISDS